MARARRFGGRLRRVWQAAVARVAAGVVGAHDAGMSTAEYAVGTVAACGFAAVLYKVITSTQVLHLLGQLVQRALSATF